MRSIFRMPSDDLAGATKWRVPTPKRRKANAQRFQDAFRRPGRCHEVARADTH